jgi:hypothetical protein
MLAAVFRISLFLGSMVFDRVFLVIYMAATSPDKPLSLYRNDFLRDPYFLHHFLKVKMLNMRIGI